MLKLPKANQHLVDIAPTFPLLAQIKYRTAQKGKKICAIYSSTSFSTYFVHMMRTLQLCGRVGMEEVRFLAGPRGQVRAWNQHAHHRLNPGQLPIEHVAHAKHN